MKGGLGIVCNQTKVFKGDVSPILGKPSSQTFASI